MIHLPAKEFSLPLLQPANPVSIVAGILTEVEVGNPEVVQHSVNRARSSSTVHTVSSFSQSILNIDHLSIIRDFLVVQVSATNSQTRERKLVVMYKQK